ncbi:hypothetical protein GMPD_18390 [Geomonas paludis]|uniref:Uncharacterized protein n=1 Tax=Geomonas paludis TaxID=2740185 RepID=A0A6V8MUZ7_9BACT|nr:hypothetical protein GMPD_18390 [Geomonas paludis]
MASFIRESMRGWSAARAAVASRMTSMQPQILLNRGRKRTLKYVFNLKVTLSVLAGYCPV